MRKLKVCFIGAGSIGSRHMENLADICKKRNIQLQIDILRSTNRPLKTDIEHIVSNIYTAIEKIDIFYDMIFITNPTYLHYKTIKALKNYAKYFFVEKPIFNSLKESVKEMALPPDNVYYIACPLRYTQILQKAKTITDMHKPISVRIISSSYLPDWRPTIDYRNTYSAHRSQGGGVCIDLIHEWDYMTWLFGQPLNVKSFCGKYSNLEIDSDDLAVYVVQYKDFLAEIHLDYFGRIPERKLEIYTQEDFYVFDIINNKILKNGVVIYKSDETSNEKYIKELEYFMTIYENDASNSNDLNNAIQTLKYAICNTTGE